MAHHSQPEIVYDYVEEVDPNLICAICRSALVDPVTTTSCKHTFCRDCITQAIATNPQCPVDRSALTVHSLRDTEQLVKLMLDELKVKCGAEDCGQIMQRGLLLGHVRTCLKTAITCQDAECGLSMARFRLPHHRGYECFQRRMQCSKCQVILTFKDRTLHDHPEEDKEAKACELCGEPTSNADLHRWNCTRALVPCPQSHRGCQSLPAREDLTTHLATCPFEALSTFFEMNDTRFRAVEDRAISMAAEVESLKEELRLTRASMSMRQTFGDRWRAAGLERSGSAGVPGLRVLGGFAEPTRSPVGSAQVPASLAAQLAQSPPLSPPVELRPPTERQPEPAPYPRERDADDVEGPPAVTAPDVAATTTVQTGPASPTPTTPRSPPVLRAPLDTAPSSPTGNANEASGITSRAAADMSAAVDRPFLIAPVAAPNSFADFAFSQLSTGSNDNVNLEALRNISVHLAAGLDQMERRQELRTMTENLRILDEVGSLRAIVNTMRMQVMMDRPNSPGRVAPRMTSTVTVENSRPTDLAFTSYSHQLIPPPPAPRPARGLHRSMLLAHRSMQSQNQEREDIAHAHDHAREADREMEREVTQDVEGWRRGVHESVAFSVMGTRASSGVYGNRAESVTSSMVTVGNGGVRGRPMAIPDPAEPEERNPRDRTLRVSRTNPFGSIGRRMRHYASRSSNQ